MNLGSSPECVQVPFWDLHTQRTREHACEHTLHIHVHTRCTGQCKLHGDRDTFVPAVSSCASEGFELQQQALNTQKMGPNSTRIRTHAPHAHKPEYTGPHTRLQPSVLWEHREPAGLTRHFIPSTQRAPGKTCAERSWVTRLQQSCSALTLGSAFPPSPAPTPSSRKPPLLCCPQGSATRLPCCLCGLAALGVSHLHLPHHVCLPRSPPTPCSPPGKELLETLSPIKVGAPDRTPIPRLPLV